ncbi:hypothetical protein AYO45_06660 [Gammaproteobacteria bacterium SCGC AG-212-F23]|nr:hypothetical protein AYO45_06660 [Gammaproteobacteria bacterium SCGC AG-212-F23]
METGAFPDKKSLASACEDVIKAGADFLKTSTGKIAIGATLESAEVLLNAIQKSGKPIGLKVSGGIKTIEQATQYLTLTQQIMGQNWASLTTFRLGASQLIDLIIK